VGFAMGVVAGDEAGEHAGVRDHELSGDDRDRDVVDGSHGELAEDFDLAVAAA